MSGETMTTWEVLVGVWAAEDEAADDAEGPFVSRAVREAVLRGGLVEPIDGDRCVAVPMLMHGLTLLHRISDAEHDLGVLEVDPDLAPLREPAAMGARLETGDTLRLVGAADHALAGPRGWLSPFEPGQMVAVRLHRAQVRIEPARTTVPRHGRGVDALVQAARRLLQAAYAKGEPLVQIRRVVWAALAFGRDRDDARPHLLDHPAPPLSEVFAAAGLACSGQWLHDPPARDLP